MRLSTKRATASPRSALREAGVLGQLPTPLEEVQRAAGIVARHDIGALPPGLATAGRTLLGAFWFERRAVHVDLTQPAPRRRFTDAHEAIHALCPWHEAVLREDTAAELFRTAREAIEAEANYGAAQLIFQGRRFAARLADAPAELATAVALAEAQRDGSLPVWSSVSSPAFARRFGAAAADLAPGAPLLELVEAARAFAPPPAAIVPFAGGTCAAEAHYNRRCFYVLIAERRSGRRRAA